jgi:acyl-CoA dehydrogenase
MSAGELLAGLSADAHRLGRELGPALETLDETTAARRALGALADARLIAWCVPAEHGGADAGALAAPSSVSVRALCALRSALAYHSAMLDVMLVMQGLGSFALTAHEKLRRELLPAVARGEKIAAFALTEPGAGSSLGDIATRALRTSNGWRLDGHKTFISNAGIADFYTVLARTSGEVGKERAGDRGALTMFYVPASSNGVTAERFEILGPHPIGDVRFSDVAIPDEHRLGEEGSGLALALSVLARFRTSVAAAACGMGRRALDESMQHLASRRQFGQALSSFQGLAFDVAEMDTRLRAAECLVDEAARAVDGGGDATREVARAKLFATETASWACDRAVQHLGGLGVKRGHPVERLYRNVRALRIYEGTSEIQKLILSKALFSSARPPAAT